MGWLSVMLSGIAAFLLYRTGHVLLAVLAIAAALGCFWSWGIMHNYAMDRAKRRRNFTGGFYDISRKEAQAVPDWITWLNMGFSLFGLVLLIIAIARTVI